MTMMETVHRRMEMMTRMRWVQRMKEGRRGDPRDIRIDEVCGDHC